MSGKICETSLKILQILKMLKTKIASVDDICDFFNQECAKETVIKYINTMRSAGFYIKKIKEGYKLLNDPVEIDLDENQLLTLRRLELFAKELSQPILESRLNNIFQKIELLFSSETFELSKELKCDENESRYKKYEESIKVLSEYCNENRKVKIKYEDGDYILDPIAIQYENKNVYLLGYNVDSNQRQIFLLDKINNSTQTPQLALPESLSGALTFKIFGRLAKNYSLYEGEKILEVGEDFKVIVNTKQSHKYLYKRLLKYGSNCQIMFPREDRENFKQLVKEIIDSYDEEEGNNS